MLLARPPAITYDILERRNVVVHRRPTHIGIELHLKIVSRSLTNDESEKLSMNGEAKYIFCFMRFMCFHWHAYTSHSCRLF